MLLTTRRQAGSVMGRTVRQTGGEGLVAECVHNVCQSRREWARIGVTKATGVSGTDRDHL